MTLPLRRLWALIYWLPADSAYRLSLDSAAEPEPALAPRTGMSLAEFAQQHAA